MKNERNPALLIFLAIIGIVSVFAIKSYISAPSSENELSAEDTARTSIVSEMAKLSALREPEYVGREQCLSCHEQQYQAWQGSHHDLAMQEANEKTVLGDFNDTKFTYHGVTSRFFRKDGRYLVNTDNSKGELQDFEIKYTFGFTPLQQYLIEFPGGRLQALNIVWDTHPKEQGGQRWVHLYSKEKVDHN